MLAASRSDAGKGGKGTRLKLRSHVERGNVEDWREMGEKGGRGETEVGVMWELEWEF